MRIAILSDLHAHPHRTGGTDPIGRVNDAVAVLKAWLREDAEVHLFCGDLFHAKGSLPVVAANAVLGAFADRPGRGDPGLDLLVLAGNHDLVGQGTTESAVRTLDLFGATVVETPKAVQHGSTMILAVPYQRFPVTNQAAIFEQVAAAAARLVEEGYDEDPLSVVLALHQYLTDAAGNDSVPEEENVSPEWVQALETRLGHRIDLVVSGHDHRPRTFIARGTAYIVPGASLQHNYGDAGSTRGYFLVDVVPGQVNASFIESTAPRFHVLSGADPDWSNVGSADFARVLAPAGTDTECPERCIGRVELVPVAPERAATVRADLLLSAGPGAVMDGYLAFVEPEHPRRAVLSALGRALYREGNPGEVVL